MKSKINNIGVPQYGRYICMRLVREKSIEQIQNNKQPFSFTVLVAYQVKKVIKSTILQKHFFKINRAFMDVTMKETMLLRAN